MANNKIGFDFYSVDTNRYQDIKIKRLKKDFSCHGISVYDYILCEVYRLKGCFIMWDDSTAFDVSDYFGLKETLVREIVSYCGTVGLFNKELLINGNIISSRSIQLRYIDMCVRSRRKNIKIPENLRLISFSELNGQYDVNILQNVCILSEDSAILPQSKVKESKVKKEDTSHPQITNQNSIPIEHRFMIPIDSLLDFMLSDSKWIEDLARVHKLSADYDKSIESAKEWIVMYVDKLRSENVKEKPRKECFGHCSNWIKQEKNKQLQNGRKEIPEQTVIRRKATDILQSRS